MMNRKLAMFVLSATLVSEAMALEVDREVLPQISLGGRVIATMDAVDYDSDPSHKSDISTEDSVLMLGFDKRLYDNQSAAGAIVGLKEAHEEVRFHQLQTYYWNRDIEVNIGRGNLPNFVVELPTLRDDDLRDYSRVANASSNDEFDQAYGERLMLDWFIDRANQSLSVWGASRSNGASFTTAPEGIDSYGLGYRYRQSEDVQYVHRLRHAGVLLDRQKVESGGKTEWMNAIVAGAELNLNMNPQANWSTVAQLIVNSGRDGASSVATVSDQAQLESTSMVAGIKYTARPNLLTRWYAGVTLAYKDYDNLTDAEQWSVVPNIVRNLGQGVTVMAQIKHTDYGAALGGGKDTAVQLGMAFSFDARFNGNVSERNSILNLEHGYIQ